jgi:hypothetical protein
MRSNRYQQPEQGNNISTNTYPAEDSPEIEAAVNQTFRRLLYSCITLTMCTCLCLSLVSIVWAGSIWFSG